MNQDDSPRPVFHLSTEGEFEPANTSLPAQVNDLDAFYYWKDAIEVGSYVHPLQNFSLDITRDRLDGFIDTFRRMKNNGVGIPILMDHDARASATLGWIVDVKREEDRLLELHQFLGADARDIGLRNKVSLGIDPNFTDGKGVCYGEAIVHSAITSMPVVPNQGEFEPVCLSLKKPGKQVAAEAANPLPEKADDMLQLAMASVADAVAAKRDLAIARGAISPAVAEELFSLLVQSKDSNLRTLALSRTANSSPLALAIFDTVLKNKPTPLGESTRLQALSRVVPSTEASELQTKMIQLASGK